MDPYLEQVWEQLRQVLSMIFQNKKPSMSLQCAYEVQLWMMRMRHCWYQVIHSYMENPI